MKDKFNMNINRREFLNLFAGFTTAAACPVFFSGCEEPDPVPGNNAHVSSAWIQKGDLNNSYASFKYMVESATDFSWLSSGDSVFIKLAMDSYHPFPATTDPRSLDFMIQLLKEKGAGLIYAGGQSGLNHVMYLSEDSLSAFPANIRMFFKLIYNVVGSGQIQSGSSRECCRRAGLLSVIESNGAIPVFFEEAAYSGYNPVTIPESSWDSAFYITNALDNADHIVNLPRVGTHFMAGTCLGLMTGVEYMRDDSRLLLLSDENNFHKKYVDINFAPVIESKTRLSVSSGMKVMTTDGPDTGTVEEPDVGLVFASESIFAHDLLATAWLEANREKISGDIDIYKYPSINYYMSLKGSLDSLEWIQLNQNPDSDTVDFMKALLNV